MLRDEFLRIFAVIAGRLVSFAAVTQAVAFFAGALLMLAGGAGAVYPVAVAVLVLSIPYGVAVLVLGASLQGLNPFTFLANEVFPGFAPMVGTVSAPPASSPSSVWVSVVMLLAMGFILLLPRALRRGWRVGGVRWVMSALAIVISLAFVVSDPSLLTLPFSFRTPDYTHIEAALGQSPWQLVWPQQGRAAFDSVMVLNFLGTMPLILGAALFFDWLQRRCATPPAIDGDALADAIRQDRAHAESE